MRRIKVILAVVVAAMIMTAVAAPAMADVDVNFSGGFASFDISGGGGDAVGVSGADGGSSVGNVGEGSIDIGGLSIN